MYYHNCVYFVIVIFLVGIFGNDTDDILRLLQERRIRLSARLQPNQNQRPMLKSVVSHAEYCFR